MARKIPKTEWTQEFRELLKESRGHNEKEDCAVKAIAITTGKSYTDVRQTLEMIGRKHRNGTYIEDQIAACKALGYRMRKLTNDEMIALRHSYPSRIPQSITTYHPRRYPTVWKNKPPMIFRVRGHVAGFKDGELHDWSTNRTLAVKEIYLIEPLNDNS